ncbi:3-oxoacyl-[acyl-carrier-protein] reductase [Clostridium estertheticum]|uniref:3-oxoacyl-[acyl-carrier-protein] reductase n=2 Tax=Clostridium estertheticum TaxID=238834 RepID=A0A5N7J6Y4_9CLOT|nr:3-oxoacyl-[acyl-carrier-protein] reductase [Clostridium estertheticum]MBU3075567.1 3-oxoacyl-[acyl-carrier-protein] reductase [Clostridium estertheticum]MBU3164851.1 3-oxoacyl-[acyl-carrier-protein] reductase [Clostridium estertheticum]MBU3187876.1 3-oxoacyl-[acyl-carrier-protein] reductase [Clostridium estertheticum]MCB2342749.1 3-oxoacyl-[acyl-carrier-protein] reductase [Clostridium estertheticum]MPQ33832.1 3-oxoacyl-[acyl-carrier-protein] reductase [Clostridium estertheticum]
MKDVKEHELMLKGKTAVVTGASRGIGRAIALKLAKHGANVVVNYRNSVDAVQEVVKEIEDLGVKVLAIQADISSYDDVENMIKKSVEEFGSIDILVNNAGITKDGLLMRMKEADFDSVIDINLKGAFNCTRHVAAIMLKQRSGRIINISSVSGITGNAGQVNYSAAKAGIIGMTKSVAREFGGRGVTCNAVAPGYIQTDMTEDLSAKVKDTIMGTIPLKRLGRPEDVANVVAFLATDEAAYITGQVINVDGGMAM